jgi:hypothetical protein
MHLLQGKLEFILPIRYQEICVTRPNRDLSQNPDNYKAYLIRMWQDSPHIGWRASAQSVRSGQVIHFASLAALFAFLQTRTIGAEDVISADEKK